MPHRGVVEFPFQRLQGCPQSVFLFFYSLSWFMLPSRYRRGIIYAD